MSISSLSPPALVFRNLTLGYDRHPAVHHLDGLVASGALLAIVGPNGAGKSTLVKAIAGTLAPIEGRIETASDPKTGIAYLPQSAAVDRSFPITVYDLVSMGAWRSIGLFGGLKPAHRDAVAHAIEAVGLQGLERRPIGTLSGGQMQRALFARLLLQDANIILLDEPFSAIDARTTADLLGLVGRWHTEGRTVVAVLHDMGIVREHFAETLLLAREVVAWGPTAETLSAENLLRARRMVEDFTGRTDIHSEICDEAA